MTIGELMRGTVEMNMLQFIIIIVYIIWSVYIILKNYNKLR